MAGIVRAIETLMAVLVEPTCSHGESYLQATWGLGLAQTDGGQELSNNQEYPTSQIGVYYFWAVGFKMS